jgi:predicted RNase H-like HicB family nuclease
MRDYYMIVERDEEGWYIGSIPEFPGCHTQGATIDELKERMAEAAALYSETSGNEPPVSEFIGVHKVSVA